MDVQQFEQAILKMAFETDARITTASVAYYLGIPSRKANELLEELLDQGVLELDSDDEGNLFYHLPNQGDAPGVSAGAEDDGWSRLEAAADAAASGNTDNAEPPEPSRSQPRPQLDSQFVASVDDESADEAFSPSQFSPHQGADGHSPDRPADGPDTSVYSTDDQGDRRSNDWFHTGEEPSQTGPYDYGRSRRSRSSRFEGIPGGVTSRMGRTDARADRCGSSSSVVVESTAACEPRPLAESKPTVTSCNEVDTSQFSTHQDYGGFGFTAPSKSTALAKTSHAGEMALQPDGQHIEQPEHQPGMALLLSLILCGTGQIYNGEVSKGIIMLILSFLLWFVFLGWVVHIWSIVDAVVVAERINRKSGSQN